MRDLQCRRLIKYPWHDIHHHASYTPIANQWNTLWRSADKMIHDKPRHGPVKYGGVCSLRFGISCILYPTNVHKTCLHFIYGAPLKVLKSMQNIVVVITVQTTYQLSAKNPTICWLMKKKRKKCSCQDTFKVSQAKK